MNSSNFPSKTKSKFIGLIESIRHPPLLYQYFFYAAIIIAFTLITCFGITYSEKNSYTEEYNILIQKDAIRIAHTFDESIQFAESIAGLLALKFMQGDNRAIENMDFLIEHQRPNFFNDAFSWNIFHYVTPSGDMILNGMKNKKASINLHDYQREWLDTAKKDPFRLHFSKPGIGAITKKFVFSTGYGFTDDKGAFKGYISVGIEIARLVNVLKKAASNNVTFILLDKNMHIVFISEPELYTTKLPTLQIDKIKNRSKTNNDILASPIEVSGYYFNCAVQSKIYPFTFLVGQSNKIYKQKVQQHVLPQIIRNMAMGIIFVSALLFVGYQAISPILELSRDADKISKGKDIFIKHYSNMELNVLAKQLSKISETNKALMSQQSMLTKANNDLKHANELIQNNMSFLSHELKNPVSSMINFAQILHERLNKIGEQRDKDSIDLIYQAALQQDKQIDFFLKLCKFQECGKVIESEPVDLRQLIFLNINMVRHHAIQKKVNIEVDIDEEIPMILGDEIMIGQIIQNLAANGAKYNKEGGKLTVKAFVRNNSKGKKDVVIEFIDTGIGINDEDLEKLFKKFKRIEDEKNSLIFGYGIGLNYVKTCVIAHNATIDVRSKVGVGTVFSVIFPSYMIA